MSANAGVVTMTLEHLNLLVALDLHFFIVVTKVDVTSKQKFNDTIDSLKKVLSSAGIHKVDWPAFLNQLTLCFLFLHPHISLLLVL